MVKKYAFVIGLAQAVLLWLVVKDSTPASMDFLLSAVAFSMVIHTALNMLEFALPYIVAAGCLAAIRWLLVVVPVAESTLTSVSALCVVAGLFLIFQAIVATPFHQEAEPPGETI